jgi:putative membrane protein
MNNLTRRALAGLLLAFVLPTAHAADPATKVSGPSMVSKDDMTFFQKAAQTEMLELQAAEIASSRALAPTTKTFASTMTTEHGANNDALKALATSKGVTLPVKLADKYLEALEKLRKEEPKEFDKRYAEIMQEGHKQAIELFKERAKESKDADIRGFASDTLPALQHHLEMARQLTAKS